MAIVETVGGASSNSYLSLADANSYFSTRLSVSAWTSNSDDQEKALISAARKLQAENWLGSRASSTQSLAWPRSGVAKVDSVGSTDYSYRPYYLVTEIPQEVKDAQCELALWLLATNKQPGAVNRRVTSWSADGVSASYEYDGVIQTLPDEVNLLIGKLIADVQVRRG